MELGPKQRRETRLLRGGAGLRLSSALGLAQAEEGLDGSCLGPQGERHLDPTVGRQRRFDVHSERICQRAALAQFLERRQAAKLSLACDWKLYLLGRALALRGRHAVLLEPQEALEQLLEVVLFGLYLVTRRVL